MKKITQKNPVHLENLIKIKVQTITTFILFLCCTLSLNAQTYTLSDKNREICNCSSYTPIDILTGDADIACAPSAVTLTITGGSKVGASASVTAEKKISYIPPSTFSGSDNLQYRVLCNGSAFTGTVNITVTEPEDIFVNDIWYFGANLGIIFRKNSSGSYVPYDVSGTSKINTGESVMTIASPYCDGECLFYCQGYYAYNNRHEIIGSNLGSDEVADGLAACYMGNNKYLLFVTTGYYGTSLGVYACTIDMSANNGKGMYTGNYFTVQSPSTSMSETIELVARAGTTHQYWIIFLFGSTLYSHLVDVSDPDHPAFPGGWNTCFADNVSYRSFTLYASLQGDRLAMAYSGGGGFLELFDFNNNTGAISNRRYVYTGTYSNSTAFSPSGKYVYITQYDGTSARLIQYETSTLAEVGRVQFWEQTSYDRKGGGLELGPDGKMYVTQDYSQYIGVIEDPDSNTPLGDGYTGRYKIHGFELSRTAGNYYNFPTRLTKPAIPLCNTNHAPIANADNGVMCSTSSGSSVTVNVLLNDEDEDGNTIYLTDAQFMNSSDAAYASLTVNASLGTVALTIKSGVSVPANHIFYIEYNIEDNSIPISKCASGLLQIYYNPVVSVNISASQNDICSDIPVAVTFTATPNDAPAYQWVKNSSDISGANASTYNYEPANGDIITCRVTDTNGICPAVTSNAITMKVTKPRKPSITITAVPD